MFCVMRRDNAKWWIVACHCSLIFSIEISERRPIAGVNLDSQKGRIVTGGMGNRYSSSQGPQVLGCRSHNFVTCIILSRYFIRSTSAQFSGIGLCYDSMNPHIQALAVSRGRGMIASTSLMLKWEILGTYFLMCCWHAGYFDRQPQAVRPAEQAHATSHYLGRSASRPNSFDLSLSY